MISGGKGTKGTKGSALAPSPSLSHNSLKKGEGCIASVQNYKQRVVAAEQDRHRDSNDKKQTKKLPTQTKITKTNTNAQQLTLPLRSHCLEDPAAYFR